MEQASSKAISAEAQLDAALERFAKRRLEEPSAYLLLDARYEKVRLHGVIRSQALLIGISGEGRREVLVVELVNRESDSPWKVFLLGLRERRLRGVEFVVSDDHHGIKQPLREVLPETASQRCYVHFRCSAFDHLQRNGQDDCLQALRALYERCNLAQAQQDLAVECDLRHGPLPRCFVGLYGFLEGARQCGRSPSK